MGFFYKYELLRHTLISWGEEKFVKLGSFEEAAAPNQIKMDSIYWFWGGLGLIYMLCEPFIGAITYLIGLGMHQSVIYLYKLDDEQMKFGGDLFKIMCAV